MLLRGGLRGAELETEVAGVVLVEAVGEGVPFSESSGIISSFSPASGDISVNASKSASIVDFAISFLGIARRQKDETVLFYYRYFSVLEC